MDLYKYQATAKAIAERANLTIVWETSSTANPMAGVPRTDGTRIYLPTPGSVSIKDQGKVFKYLTHEVEHLLSTDFEVFKNWGIDARDGLLGILANLFEDDRIDKNTYKKYAGDRIRMEELYQEASVSNIQKMLDASKENKEYEKLAAVMIMQPLNRAHYMIYPQNILDSILPALTGQIKTYIDKYMSGDYINKLERMSKGKEGTAETIELAKIVAKEVFGMTDKEIEEQEKKAKSRRNKSNDCSERDNDSSEHSKASSEGGEGDKGDKVDEGEDILYAKYKELDVPSVHEEQILRKRKTGLHLDYTHYVGSRKYIPSPLTDIAIANFRKHYFYIAPPCLDSHHVCTGSYEALKSKAVSSKNLASKLRRLLQIRSKARYEYGLKEGTIHQRNLYRVGIKNAAGYNEKIFKKKIESTVLDCCVQLIIDFSGSMSGAKIRHAMLCSTLLNESIGNSLGIKLEILGFSEYGRHPLHFIFREFNDRILLENQLVVSMHKAEHSMIGNADGEMILWAYHRIKQRPEKNKVMIVLSDGQPACGKAGDIVWYTKEAIKRIEKEKIAKIYGIGIMDKNVERLYTHRTVINSVEELEVAVLDLIKKSIIA